MLKNSNIEFTLHQRITFVDKHASGRQTGMDTLCHQFGELIIQRRVDFRLNLLTFIPASEDDLFPGSSK